jgi:hypothetical protein
MNGIQIAVVAAALAAGAAWTAAAAGAAAGAGAGGGAVDTSHARLHNFECRKALEPSQREVSVDAVMHPLPGTAKLLLRFQLLSRTGRSAPFTPVRGGDLGKWISPSSPITLGQRPGDVWVFSHPVVGLVAPASYRFRVSFRWIGAKGRVLGTAVDETKTCYQPELRPDLVLRSLTVQAVPGKPDSSDYVAVVANDGATGAGPFNVELISGGATAATRTVNWLGPHTSRTVMLRGPVCSPGAPPTVTVDPTHQVTDDLNVTSNSASAVC